MAVATSLALLVPLAAHADGGAPAQRPAAQRPAAQRPARGPMFASARAYLFGPRLVATESQKRALFAQASKAESAIQETLEASVKAYDERATALMQQAERMYHPSAGYKFADADARLQQVKAIVAKHRPSNKVDMSSVSSRVGRIANARFLRPDGNQRISKLYAPFQAMVSGDKIGPMEAEVNAQLAKDRALVGQADSTGPTAQAAPTTGTAQ